MGINDMLAGVAVIFLTLASILLIQGKALQLVPGYNDLTEQEKARLDAKKTGRRLGIPMGIVDITVIFFLAVSYFSESEQLRTFAGYGMLVVVIASFAIVDVARVKSNRKRW